MNQKQLILGLNSDPYDSDVWTHKSGKRFKLITFRGLDKTNTFIELDRHGREKTIRLLGQPFPKLVFIKGFDDMI